jgi:hypothetical protein
MRLLKNKTILAIILSSFIFTFIFIGNSSINVLGNTIDQCSKYIFRLKSLEPESPEDIQQNSINNIPLPSKIFSITDVIKKGKEIKLDDAYKYPKWVKPTYKSYWHSTVSGGRWSYVPDRIKYASHNIFTIYPTASVFYDFSRNLGIWDEIESFKFKHNDLETIVLVVMNSNIKKIITYGNQVVVIAEPTRNGLQVIEIPGKEIMLTDEKSPVMFQLVTPDGYEIDYSLIYKHKGL